MGSIVKPALDFELCESPAAVRVHCIMRDTHTPESFKHTLLQVAAFCIEHKGDQLLLEDRSCYSPNHLPSATELFEIGVCFSEWLRGRQVAYLCCKERLGFDLELSVFTCQTNGLTLELFDDFNQAQRWLDHLQKLPQGSLAKNDDPLSFPADLMRQMN